MEIVINARLLNERKGGPYRYLVNVLNELAEIDSKNRYHILVNGDPATDYDFFKKNNFIKKVFPVKNKIIFDYILLPFYSFKNKRDIYFFPKTTFAPYIRGKKISLYNDIIYFEDFNFREFKFFDNLHHKIMIPVCARFSAADIAISGYTAQRMKALLGIKPDKIHLIYDGVEKSFRKIENKKALAVLAARYNLKTPFLFFAGSLSPRKNILNIIKGFEQIKEQIKHNLYFTAGESWNDGDVYQYIKEKKLEDRIIKLGFLSEEDLVGLYNLADCYLYPSLYEGFGLPILEAQACGCPVITSSVTSCPEVAGDSAILVDPYNPADIAEAILQVVTDRKLKQNLIKKGFDNIKRFSWTRTAEEHLELFHEVYNK